MQANRDCTRPSPLANAFSPAFLAELRRGECRDGHRDSSFAERQAVLNGPWEVERLEAGPCRGNGARYAVVRRDEPSAAGGGVFGVFRDRSPALLTAAVLPSVGSPPEFHLNRHAGGPGYAVHCGREFLGHVARDEERLSSHLDLARAFIVDPGALSRLIEAVGPEALPILGRALARRVMGGRVS